MYRAIFALLFFTVFFSASHKSRAEGYWFEQDIPEFSAILSGAEPEVSCQFDPAFFNKQKQKPVIAIVIDDMGLDRKRTARVLDLDARLTVAYLPYSPDVKKQTAVAQSKGHEVIVHLPMQPERSTANPGPDFLEVNIAAEELRARIKKNLDAFTGYEGINNHMGSKFTRDATGIDVLMDELKKRDLFFLDSKTAADSVAEDMAFKNGVPTTHRDVFLDHFDDAARVEKALMQTERIARKNGSAIAIGHPKDVTIEALQKWLPTLEEKGFQLAPVAEVIRLRNRKSDDKAVKTAATR